MERRPEPESIVRGSVSRPWRGFVWRVHSARFAPDDDSGSLRQAGGRFNVGEGSTRFRSHDAFPALYTSMESAAAVFEVLRHLGRELSAEPSRELLEAFVQRALTNLEVDVSAALDWSDERAVGLPHGILTSDESYDFTQQLAAAAHRSGVEALIVPSAAGERLANVVLYRRNFMSGSTLRVLGTTRDLNLL